VRVVTSRGSEDLRPLVWAADGAEDFLEALRRRGWQTSTWTAPDGATRVAARLHRTVVADGQRRSELTRVVNGRVDPVEGTLILWCPEIVPHRLTAGRMTLCK